MNVTDPIADLLTRLRNAARARKTLVHAPYSKMKHSVCEVLKDYGYIHTVKEVGSGIEKELMVELKTGNEGIHLKRVSKPGQRIYLKHNEIPRVLEGLGLAIISTPKGVMSGSKARKAKVGGEYICEVY
jgi:small subunit ribosomal protein S8